MYLNSGKAGDMQYSSCVDRFDFEQGVRFQLESDIATMKKVRGKGKEKIELNER